MVFKFSSGLVLVLALFSVPPVFSDQDRQAETVIIKEKAKTTASVTIKSKGSKRGKPPSNPGNADSAQPGFSYENEILLNQYRQKYPQKLP